MAACLRPSAVGVGQYVVVSSRTLHSFHVCSATVYEQKTILRFQIVLGHNEAQAILSARRRGTAYRALPSPLERGPARQPVRRIAPLADLARTRGVFLLTSPCAVRRLHAEACTHHVGVAFKKQTRVGMPRERRLCRPTRTTSARFRPARCAGRGLGPCRLLRSARARSAHARPRREARPCACASAASQAQPRSTGTSACSTGTMKS